MTYEWPVRAQEAREKEIASPEVILERVDDRLEFQQRHLSNRRHAPI